MYMKEGSSRKTKYPMRPCETCVYLDVSITLRSPYCGAGNRGGLCPFLKRPCNKYEKDNGRDNGQSI
jgi:hypothetical protein